MIHKILYIKFNMLKNITQNFTEHFNQNDISEKMDLIEKYDNDNSILLNKISELFVSTTDIPIKKIYLNDNVLNDLNIFSSERHNNSVFSEINFTTTLYGEHTLKKWLSMPTSDTDLLQKRQNNIKYLLKNKNIYKNILKGLNNIKSYENKILWFWNDVTEDLQSLYDMVYFDIPFIDSFINENELILNIFNIYKIFISPAFTIFIPIISFLLPYLLLLIFGKDIKFGTFVKFIYNMMKSSSSLFNAMPNGYGTKAKYFSIFLSGIYVFLYLQSGYFSVRNALDSNKIINILHKKINTVSNLIENFFNMLKYTNNLSISYSKSIQRDDGIYFMKDLFKSQIFHNEPKFFTNKGKILSVYNKFLKNKEGLIDILKYIGELDAYISLCKLYKKFNKTNNKYSFVKYKINMVNKPYINAKNLWHPNLINNPITNNIVINDKHQNLLITGPNKAGKSIFIKSLATSILLSQTIGIVPASKFTTTIFQIVDSYLHIPDSTGYESLFEAEMHRAKKHIDMLKKMNKNENAFIIMDEIFTSTNYIEGYSAAYAICKRLSKFNNSISIITTHYTELNSLEEETKGKIVNYKFSITRDEKNMIKYPHILERGYSNQYIALELLRNDGFDKEIIKDALEKCNKIRYVQD